VTYCCITDYFMACCNYCCITDYFVAYFCYIAVRITSWLTVATCRIIFLVACKKS